MSAGSEFEALLVERLIPEFCSDDRLQLEAAGFDLKSNRLTEADAEDFLRAWNAGLATHLGRGRYLFGSGRIKEQFFWEGAKVSAPRRFTLWLEPLITLAAIARLHLDHGWPIARLASQSNDGAFDVLGLAADGQGHALSGEVKKTRTEVDQLVDLMAEFGRSRSSAEPTSSKARNAFRKTASLRKSGSEILWVVGPGRYERMFKVTYLQQGLLEFSESDVGILSFLPE